MGAVEHREFDHPSGQLVRMIRLAQTAMSCATASVLDADLDVGDSLSAAAKALHALRHELDDHAAVVLTLDRSAERDVRTVIVGVQVGADAEGIGDLARSVADVARSRRSKPAIPTRLHPVISEMGHVCLDMIARAGDVVESQTTETAAELDRGDDEMRRLQQLLYRELSGSGSVDVRTAIDVTLLGCYYERCADHAMSVARHVALGAPEAPSS